jgi:DNA-binding transcriptional LysR family regulator
MVNAMEALEPAVIGGLGVAILPAGVALSGLRSGARVGILRGAGSRAPTERNPTMGTPLFSKSASEGFRFRRSVLPEFE